MLRTQTEFSFGFCEVDCIWFFHAEEKGITNVGASLITKTEYFGNSLSKMWKDSFGNVGKYGEIFEGNFATLFERSGKNNLNIIKGPQMFVMPI